MKKGSDSLEVKMEASIITRSIRKGKTDVLLQWIDLNKNKLYRISWAYLKNHADVEDVFHNTIIKVMENINKLKNEEAFETWFISILLNECRKLLRENKKIISSEELETESCLCAAEDENLKLELTEGLKKIDDEYRELILLKYYSGYSQQEISDILKIPLGTVKSKLFRGLRMLREVLGKEE
jgi:RNA polymerase sigma-70 factor (ECF subfamily)